MASLRPLLVPLAALAATALALPGEAEACSPDPCLDSNRFTQFDPLGDGAIASDGVLAFRVQREGYAIDDTQALAYVQVEVTDAQAMPVAGTLEMIEPWRLALWRPAAPLSSGATYQVSVLVDNEALALAHDEYVEGFECGPDIVHDFALTAGDALPQLGAIEATPVESHSVEELVTLESLVCCDGAMPKMEDNCGYGDTWWDTGTCASLQGHGWIDAGFMLGTGALAPEVAADLAFELVGDEVIRTALPGAEQVTLRDDVQVCLYVEITSLATGQTVTTGQSCFGDDVPSTLGIIDIDPSAGLAECVGEPYTCAVQSDGWSGSWDPTACEPWGGGGSGGEAGSDSAGSDTGPLDGGSWGDEGDEGSATLEGGSEGGGSQGGQDGGGIADRGCSCTAQPRAGASGLLAIALVALRRRRSRR
jgi:hypothetical protein